MRRELCSAFLLVCLACGGGGGSDGNEEPENQNPTGPNTPTPTTPTTPTTPANDQVSVQDNSYSPATVTVTPGTTVTWTWSSSNYASHSVTFNDGNESSAAKTSGTHQRTFTNAGTFTYYCEVHGTGMSGSVVVKAP